MNTDKFHNKAGELTVYALKCGYCEEWSDEKRHISLYGCCSGSYDVTVYEYGRTWESFKTLTEARKYYKKKIREYKQITKDSK